MVTNLIYNFNFQYGVRHRIGTWLVNGDATLKSNAGGQKVCKKKNLSWLFGADRKICPSGSLFGLTRQSRDAKQWPSDGFFYPHLTPMKDSYNVLLQERNCSIMKVFAILPQVFEVMPEGAGVLTPKYNLEPPHYDGIQSLAIQGTTLFSGSRDTCIKKWDLATQSLVQVKLMWAAAWQNQQNDVCQAKTQISLGVCPVWSESSLCAQ